MSGHANQAANAAARIHQTLSRTTTFWKGFTFGELAVLCLPVVLFVVGGALKPAWMPYLYMPILFGICLGLFVFLLVLHKARPSYMRLTEWLGVRLSWAFQDDTYEAVDDGADTSYAHQLARVTPTSIVRKDGAHVSAIQIRPANMALKDSDSWSKAIGSLATLVNGALDKNVTVKLYSPTRQLSNETFIRDHQARLEDDDVQSLPVLRELLRAFVDDHTTPEGHIDSEKTLVREFYLVVWVTDDALTTQEADHGVVPTLASLPVIGRAFGSVSQRDLTAAEREELKAEKLEDKLRTIREGVNSLYQCSGRPVTGPQLAELLEEYWTCRPIDYDDPAQAYTPMPIVHGGADTDADVTTTADDPDPHHEDAPADEDETSDSVEDSIPTPSDRHQSAIAPSAIEWHRDHAIIDEDTYVRTFWIEAFPEEPVPGLFEDVLLSPELNVDFTLYLDPYSSQSALDLINEWVTTLRANKQDKSDLVAEDIEIDVERAKEIRQLVRRNKTSLVELGAFVRITAPDEETLRHRTNKFEAKIQDAPANCVTKRTIRRTEEGLIACSPIGPNALGGDRLSVATGEAVGRMFPFSSSYLRMPGGIEYGNHGHNDSGIHIDPWALETGHSELVTGMPGAGKTHAAQARALRMLKRHDDVKQVIIDPVGDLQGTADELDAKTVTVSGDTALNPCEMHPTPPEILEQSPDMNPVSAKKEEVYGVIENFLASRDIELEMHSGLVTYIIDRIFEDSAIDPGDPSTHTPENSPTMQDFLAVCDQLAENPNEWGGSQAVEEKIQEYASELRVALQPFAAGSTHGNLSKESDLDVLTSEDKIVYIDLRQVEGSGDGLGKQSFIMQLLLSKVYQQAKMMDDRVEVLIDEAHYLFQDDANLAFINQIARHQRHAGLRLILLSQRLSDFYDAAGAEKIAGMCPIQVHHREPTLDQPTAQKAKLSREQATFIRQAQAGKENEGYSQALVRVDEHGDYPVAIATSEFEKLIIEYDQESQRILEELVTEETVDTDAFETFVQTEAIGNFLDEHGFGDETVERLLTDGLTPAEFARVVVLAVEEYGEDLQYDPDTSGDDHTTSEAVTDAIRSLTGETTAQQVVESEDLKDWSLFDDGNGVGAADSDDD